MVATSPMDRPFPCFSLQLSILWATSEGSGFTRWFILWLLVPQETMNRIMIWIPHTSLSLHEDEMNFLGPAGAQGTRGRGGRDRESSLGMKVHYCPLCSGHGHTLVGRRPPFRFFSFTFIAQLFWNNIFPNSVFSCIPTHFSFLHLLLRFQVLTRIILFCPFSSPLSSWISLSGPFDYRLPSRLSPSWPRDSGSGIIQGLPFRHCWALTVLRSLPP